MNIAVAGTGYVGLSLAVLLSQHNHVIAVDVVPEKVDLINRGLLPSPIRKSKTTWRTTIFHSRPRWMVHRPMQKLIWWS